jgi:hypothetical protein
MICALFALFLHVVLVIRPRSSHMLGKCYTTELHPQLLVTFFQKSLSPLLTLKEANIHVVSCELPYGQSHMARN